MADTDNLIRCDHWTAVPGLCGGGACAIGLYGGLPSHGVCRFACSHGHKEQPMDMPSVGHAGPFPQPDGMTAGVSGCGDCFKMDQLAQPGGADAILREM